MIRDKKLKSFHQRAVPRSAQTRRRLLTLMFSVIIPPHPTPACTATPHPPDIQVSGHGFSRAATTQNNDPSLPPAGRGPRHARFSRGGVEGSRAATRSAHKPAHSRSLIFSMTMPEHNPNSPALPHIASTCHTSVRARRRKALSPAALFQFFWSARPILAQQPAQ